MHESEPKGTLGPTVLLLGSAPRSQTQWRWTAASSVFGAASLPIAKINGKLVKYLIIISQIEQIITLE